ncbi:MAG: hypothetical protein ABL888_01960 [Pirellulaceae bacterium]
MQWFRLRPTFQLELIDSREVVIEKLKMFHGQASNSDHFQLFGEYGELHLPAREHRLWSPHLSFYVLAKDSGSTIHGRFAPRVDVWTVVWISYLLMIFTAFFSGALAISQWQLGQSLWGLWLMITALLVWALIYVVAQVGQQWSGDQMLALRERLEAMLLAAGITRI